MADSFRPQFQTSLWLVIQILAANLTGRSQLMYRVPKLHRQITLSACLQPSALSWTGKNERLMMKGQGGPDRGRAGRIQYCGRRKKAELDELDTNLETLSRQIDRERIYMDRTSQYDIDSFNLKVNRYNSALRNRKAEAEVFNDMVDTHNTIVQQLKAQNRRVNELVDNYNAKLPRYGR